MTTKTVTGDKTSNGICFVAMPAGRSEVEHRAYIGWFEAVFQPAIHDAGLKAFLSVRQDAPVHITDEIRGHLVNDEVALFDLGGLLQDDGPNANVMYELGIRHAFDRPSVIYGWRAALLPFDVKEQRAVVEPRELGSVTSVRSALTAAIKAAVGGDYYRPMERIARAQLIAKASDSDSAIRALAEQVAGLATQVSRIDRNFFQPMEVQPKFYLSSGEAPSGFIVSPNTGRITLQGTGSAWSADPDDPGKDPDDGK